jgi:hypothetical protein
MKRLSRTSSSLWVSRSPVPAALHNLIQLAGSRGIYYHPLAFIQDNSNQINCTTDASLILITHSFRIQELQHVVHGLPHATRRRALEASGLCSFTTFQESPASLEVISSKSFMIVLFCCNNSPGPLRFCSRTSLHTLSFSTINTSNFRASYTILR